MVHGSCTVTASTAGGNIGLAVYKNNTLISTGSLSQYLGGVTGQPFPLTIAWIGSVVNTNTLRLYLIAPANATLSAVTDLVFSVQTAGGTSMTYQTSLNSCNPQWSIAGIAADSATTLSTAEVSALTYLTTRTASSGVDAITITPPFNILKLGVYSIYVNLQFKSIAATAQVITIRLKIGGVTIITRRVQLPSTVNAYFGGTICYFYTLSSGTKTVDVTVQSSAATNYLIASGSSVIMKLIRRN
jgi:hypothetical protein